MNTDGRAVIQVSNWKIHRIWLVSGVVLTCFTVNDCTSYANNWDDSEGKSEILKRFEHCHVSNTDTPHVLRIFHFDFTKNSFTNAPVSLGIYYNDVLFLKEFVKLLFFLEGSFDTGQFNFSEGFSLCFLLPKIALVE